MQDLGIRFRPNTLIGPTITIDDMFADGYDAIFIGTGVWNPNKLRIPGETLGNVHFAIDYLKNPDSYDDLGDKVVIIGAGPAGIFSALELIKLNPSCKILIIEKGTKIEDRKCLIRNGAKS